MSKHHIETLAEQYQLSEEAKSENNSKIEAEEDSSIKLRAYQIHIEKGGSDLDNWLEAERCLKENDKKPGGVHDTKKDSSFCRKSSQGII